VTTIATCEKIQAAMNVVLAAVESGNAIDMAARSALSPAPCARWSLGNRFLAMAAGTSDARGFQQWKQVGRYVKAGAKAFYILAPRMIRVGSTTNDDGADEAVYGLRGFLAVPVFRFEDTDGRPLPSAEPKTPPPLTDVAARLGVPVRYASGNGSAYGFYSLRENTIVLHTHDADVFFHELAHAAHRRARGELKGGQDPTAGDRRRVQLRRPGADLHAGGAAEAPVPRRVHHELRAREGSGRGGEEVPLAAGRGREGAGSDPGRARGDDGVRGRGRGVAGRREVGTACCAFT